MTPHIVALLAAFTLAAAPDPYAPTAAPDPYSPLAVPAPASDADTLAAQFGRILGAASQCGMINRQRLDRASTNAKALIRAAETAGDDYMEIDDRFRDAMADGRNAILDGDSECAQADADLQELEAAALRRTVRRR